MPTLDMLNKKRTTKNEKDSQYGQLVQMVDNLNAKISCWIIKIKIKSKTSLESVYGSKFICDIALKKKKLVYKTCIHIENAKWIIDIGDSISK